MLLSALTWNCEGLKANIFTLKTFIGQHSPDLCFLSEPQVFQADIDAILEYVKGEYCHFLNSDDLYYPDLPLTKNKCSGGTLCLWRKWLDPYVSVLPVSTSAFLPIILKLPNCQVSAHFALYLPTHGKDIEFVTALADLKLCIEDISDTYPGAPIFLRGDGNVNAKNKNRVSLLEHFMNDFSLIRVSIPHKTYHHFVGAGAFDSDIDIILHGVSNPFPEEVTAVLCKFKHPEILSHHDIILSKFELLPQHTQHEQLNLITAPRAQLAREKVVWTEEGAESYKNAVSPHLRRLRDTWLTPDSQTSMSILLDMTNVIMSKSASYVNQTKTVGKKHVLKSKKTPKAILRAQKLLSKAGKSSQTKNLSVKFKVSKHSYRKAVHTL